MSILNDNDFEVYEELIFYNFLLCNSIEIKGVVEEDEICEPVQKGERYDSVSLYLRFIEGHVMVVGDFGKHCLEQLHEIALDLSRKYNLPIRSFVNEVVFDECK